MSVYRYLVLIFLGSIFGEYKIGGIFHLTGFASHWGKSELDGARLSLKDKSHFRLLVEDAKSETRECVSSFKKLVEVDKVDVVLGPTWTACYLALGPLADRYRIPVLAPSGTDWANQPVHEYRFGLFYNPKDAVVKAVEYVRSKNLKSINVVYTDEPFQVEMYKHLVDIAQSAGIKVSSEKIKKGETNFGIILKKLPKAESFTCLCDKAEFLLFQKALMLYDSKIPNFYLGGLNAEILQAGLDSTVFVDYFVASEFKSKFIEHYGYEPAPSSLMAYEVVNFLADLWEKQKSIKLTPDLIRSHVYTGDYLTIKFNRRNGIDWGDPKKNFILVDKNKNLISLQ